MKVSSFKMNRVSKTLHDDYKQDLEDLASDITICIANIRKWEMYKQASAQALHEAMEILEVEAMSSDLHNFALTDDGLEIFLDERKIN
tara:strand:- start:2 stop:265 length:264 start_codon:yes stop_codon:yes gene_type:complete